MSMAPSRAELDAMSESDLIARYDEAAATTMVGTGFYGEELHRRELKRQTRQLILLTWVIAALTVVSAGAALAVVIAS